MNAGSGPSGGPDPWSHGPFCRSGNFRCRSGGLALARSSTTAEAGNDLGRVAYRNPAFVRDLLGLGSPEARRVRLDPERKAGWFARTVEPAGVPFAMIYPEAMADGIPSSWVQVALLRLERPPTSVHARDVGFYVTGAGELPADVTARLEAFAAGLPDGVELLIR